MRGHRLAASSGVRLADLADELWITGSARPEDTLISSALHSGFKPKVGFVTGEWIAKEGLVEAFLALLLSTVAARVAEIECRE